MVRTDIKLVSVLAAFAVALLACWLFALPALAQDGGAKAEAGDARAQAGDVNIQYVDCSQVANVAAAQGQYGDASANARGIGNSAAASIANELNISVEQVNACLGSVGDDGNGGGTTDEETTNGETTEETTEPTRAGDVTSEDDVVPGTASKKTLADTSGPSLMLPTAGMILTGAGLLMLGVLRRRL